MQRSALRRQGRVLVVLLPLARVGVSVGVFAFGPLGPLLQRDLDLSRTALGGLLTALQLGALVTTLLAARLADRFGVRRVFPASQTLVGLGLLLLAAADWVGAAVAAAFVAGLGHGLMTPSLAKAALDWAPHQQRGLLLGVLQVASPLAALLASVLLPSVGLAAGWRAALQLAGLLTAATALAFALAYRDPRALAPAALPAASHRPPLADRDAWLLGAATALCGGAGQALSAFLVLYLTERQSWALPTAGLALALAQVAGAVGILGLGLLSDRALGGRRRPVLLLGMALGVVGGLAFAGAAPGTPPALLLGTALLCGVGVLGYGGVMLALVGERAGAERVAGAVGFNLTLGYAGFIGGAPAFGWLADQAGYGAAWLAVGAAFLLAALAVALVREPPAR